MVSGGIALLFLVIAVALIILFTARIKVNAFVVLLVVAILYGIAIGMPLADVVNHVKNGFGGTLSSIGIVIIAGTIIGFLLEKTGAALSMTQAILKLVGKKQAPLAMSVAGYVVSIPVFCDSGYIILSPLNRALAKETGRSMAVMAVALATGLYATHTLVPPTPGPIAAAGELGADLGAVIGLGILAALPAMIAGWIWALYFARKYEISAELEESYESLVQKYGKLPGAFGSFMPLVVPIVLILLRSVAVFPSLPFGDGIFQQFLVFIGDPVVALILGVFLALLLVRKSDSTSALNDWMSEGVKASAIILAITGAGGAFGRVLQNSPMTAFIEQNLAGLPLGIFLPFIVSAALKTAQGSSTVAIITTAAIMRPLLAPLGLDPVLTVLAIGAGSMVVSHANDSYFWVVSQFSGMSVPVAYKAYTSATLVEGVVAIIMVALMSLFV